MKTNLIGMPRPALEGFFTDIGEKAFHARQVMRWVHGRGCTDFDSMTDLSKKLRSKLSEVAVASLPKVQFNEKSSDGTQKWLFDMGQAQAVETVFIPERDRGTLCISSQVGCALDCSFCATGAQGFNRNLTAAEIMGQIVVANRELGFESGEQRKITNVVFMGMGEPLANYRNVVPVMQILTDDYGLELSRRRVTLSTSGLVPQIERLANDCNVALAVSLHAPNNSLRDQLVPINKKHPIEELLPACWNYLEKTGGRSVTFEYVMLDGVNDSDQHRKQLTRLLRGKPAKINLIPFNPFPGTEYSRSTDRRVDSFAYGLIKSGVRATVRRTRGDDIAAACGQLAGRVKDRMTARLGDKQFGVVVQR
ncbi:MAG: 23S rRNA (adenine(2503)-C(2))-methyltransferase RlmN [Pseudomonadota bacterium]